MVRSVFFLWLVFFEGKKWSGRVRGSRFETFAPLFVKREKLFFSLSLSSTLLKRSPAMVSSPTPLDAASTNLLISAATSLACEDPAAAQARWDALGGDDELLDAELAKYRAALGALSQRLRDLGGYDASSRGGSEDGGEGGGSGGAGAGAGGASGIDGVEVKSDEVFFPL
jgi:hypothetical protein